MKLLLKYFILIIASSIYLKGYSQVHLDKKAEFSVHFDSSKNQPDSVHFSFTLNGGLGSLDIISSLKSAKKENISNFNVESSLSQPITPFAIFMTYGTGNKISRTFYAEPNDSIQIVYLSDSIEMSVDRFKFSGRGSAKYMLVQSLDKLKNEYEKLHSTYNYSTYIEKMSNPNYYLSTDFDEYLVKVSRNLYTYKSRAVDTIAYYEKSVGKPISDFLRNEMMNYDIRFLSTIKSLFDASTTINAKEKIAKFYFNNIGLLSVSDSSQSFSNNYGSNFIWQEFIKQNIELYFEKKSEFPFNQLYSKLKQNADIGIREALITKLLYDGKTLYVNNFANLDSCLDDAVKTITNRRLNDLLISKLKFKKGNTIENYVFKDVAGKPYNLAKLNGKVYLLEFYFYGCAPCISFSKSFKKNVYPEFETNVNFEVVSVDGMDKQQNWSKAIESGLYTVPKSINLIAGEKFEHKIFKDYDVTGLPWAILIDRNGKIVDSQIMLRDPSIISSLIRESLK